MPGLLWYYLNIRPLDELSYIDGNFTNGPLTEDGNPGIWVWQQPGSRNVAIRYTCSLYWALTVMTNLKGVTTHEARQCLWHDPLIAQPLVERVFTILTFIVGAVFFSVIYGNIAQFIKCVRNASEPRKCAPWVCALLTPRVRSAHPRRNLYAAGTRYRERIGDLRVGADDGDASDFADRVAGSGVEDVRIANAVDLDEALVVARGDHGLVLDAESREGSLPVEWIDDRDRPGRSILPAAPGQEISAGGDNGGVDAVIDEDLHGAIRRVALADGAKADTHPLVGEVHSAR